MCYRERVGMTREAINWLVARLEDIEAQGKRDQARALEMVKELREGVESVRDRA